MSAWYPSSVPPKSHQMVSPSASGLEQVAGENGLMVTGRSADRRGASLNFSPAPRSVNSRYRRVPVVAQE